MGRASMGRASRGEMDPWLVHGAHNRESPPTGKETGCWAIKLADTDLKAGWWKGGTGRGLEDAARDAPSVEAPSPDCAAQVLLSLCLGWPITLPHG